MRISDWSSDVCSSDLAAGPGGRLGAGPHAVDQRAEPRLRHAHEVADLVGKAAPRLVAVLRRREQGAEEQDEAGGIMLFAPRPELGRAECRDRVCQYV